MAEDKPTADELAAKHPEIQEFIASMDPIGRAYEDFKAKEAASAKAPKPAPANPIPEKPKFAMPVAVTLDDIVASKPEPAGPAVVSNNAVDYVSLGAIIYKNMRARKSLSVHHTQRRLSELGYNETLNDKDGFYGDGTFAAMTRFQGDNNLPGAGLINQQTLDLLFTGDPNVSLIP